MLLNIYLVDILLISIALSKIFPIYYYEKRVRKQQNNEVELNIQWENSSIIKVYNILICNVLNMFQSIFLSICRLFCQQNKLLKTY